MYIPFRFVLLHRANEIDGMRDELGILLHNLNHQSNIRTTNIVM